MSNGLGPGPKNETVYSGPAPAVSTGTVYGGPPLTGSAYNGAAPATVYRPPAPVGSPAATPSTAAPRVGHKVGNLFFLIAGLSVLNSVLAIVGAPIAMALGLGVTRLFDYAAHQSGNVGTAIVINLIIIGTVALIGVFARQGSIVAVIIGLLLYAGDTVLLVADGVGLHIVSLIVHGIFLASIFRGFRAMQPS